MTLQTAKKLEEVFSPFPCVGQWCLVIGEHQTHLNTSTYTIDLNKSMMIMRGHSAHTFHNNTETAIRLVKGGVSSTA